MTPADLDLCRAIAEKDGWETDERETGKNYWRDPCGLWVYEDELPFLANPAEILRMSKELIKAGYTPCQCVRQVLRAKKISELWWWRDIDDCPTPSSDTYERATAESYRAME